MTVAVVAPDGPDAPVGPGAHDGPDAEWWLTVQETVTTLRGIVAARTFERACRAGIPAVKVSGAWRIWRPFVADFVVRVFTEGSIDLLKFAKAWMAEHGAAVAATLLAAISGRPQLRALPAPEPDEPEPAAAPELEVSGS